MQLIILFLIGLISSKITIKICNSNTYNFVLQFYKQGKKIDPDVLKEYEKNLNKKIENKNTKTILNILYIIPIINIITATLEGKLMHNDIRKYLEKNNGLMDMNSDEIEQYNQLKSITDKLTYINIIGASTKRSKENSTLTKINIERDQLIRITCERLMPLAYTLEEIKTLNSYTNGKYVAFRIKDLNIAVVGCKDEVEKYSIVFFPDQKIAYQLEQYTDETASQKTFIVYPYNEEAENQVQKGIDKIIQDRFKKEEELKINLIESNSKIEKPKIKNHLFHK